MQPLRHVSEHKHVQVPPHPNVTAVFFLQLAPLFFFFRDVDFLGFETTLKTRSVSQVRVPLHGAKSVTLSVALQQKKRNTRSRNMWVLLFLSCAPTTLRGALRHAAASLLVRLLGTSNLLRVALFLTYHGQPRQPAHSVHVTLARKNCSLRDRSTTTNHQLKHGSSSTPRGRNHSWKGWDDSSATTPPIAEQDSDERVTCAVHMMQDHHLAKSLTEKIYRVICNEDKGQCCP